MVFLLDKTGGHDKPIKAGREARTKDWQEKKIGGSLIKKALILWGIMKGLHTFASPFEKWELAYVSTHPNQITVIRSQFGG